MTKAVKVKVMRCPTCWQIVVHGYDYLSRKSIDSLLKSHKCTLIRLMLQEGREQHHHHFSKKADCFYTCTLEPKKCKKAGGPVLLTQACPECFNVKGSLRK